MFEQDIEPNGVLGEGVEYFGIEKNREIKKWSMTLYVP